MSGGAQPDCVVRDYNLAPHNTLSVPVTAEYYAAATDTKQLQAAIGFAHSKKLPITVLGAASNVVLPERIVGMVISPQLRGIEVIAEEGDSVTLSVAAGEDWSELVCHSLEQGWYGLENLANIPGSVGAAPVQNIGAYGVELASFLRKLIAVDTESGEELNYSNEDCGFAYRQSVFRGRWRDKKIITAVHLRLSTKFEANFSYESLRDYLQAKNNLNPSAGDIFEAVVELRGRLPDVTREPNVGSFFVNPEMDEPSYRALLKRCPDVKAWSKPGKRMRVSAADLLERCGWKGREHAGVRVHNKHSLVIVNDQHRPGTAVMECAEAMSESVAQRFGVDLQIEPRVLL